MNDFEKVLETAKKTGKSFFELKKIQYIFSILALLLIIFISYLNRDNFIDIYHRTRGGRFWLLLLLVPIRFYNYWIMTTIYGLGLNLFRIKVPTKKLLPKIVSMSFVNSILPTGSLSGLGFLSNSLKFHFKNKRTLDKTGILSVSHLMFIVSNFAGLFLTLILGFLLLILTGQNYNFNQRLLIGIIWIFLTIAVIFLVLLTNPKIVDWISWHLLKPVNFIIRKLAPTKSFTRQRWSDLINSFYQKIEIVMKSPRQVLKSCAYGFTYVQVDILTLFVIASCFNLNINIGVLYLSYFFAYLAATLGFLTNGIGVFELAFTAGLTSLGVDVASAISVSLMYRFVTYFGFLPIGWYIYHKNSSSDSGE